MIAVHLPEWHVTALALSDLLLALLIVLASWTIIMGMMVCLFLGAVLARRGVRKALAGWRR